MLAKTKERSLSPKFSPTRAGQEYEAAPKQLLSAALSFHDLIVSYSRAYYQPTLLIHHTSLHCSNSKLSRRYTDLANTSYLPPIRQLSAFGRSYFSMATASSQNGGAAQKAQAQIQPCRYKTGKTLGAGSYSVVKECVHIDTGRYYAAKVINKRLMAGREHMVS